MDLSHLKMLIHEFLNKGTYIIPEEAPLIILDTKSAMCMSKNGRYTIHTRHIYRRVYVVRNGEKCTQLTGVREV